MMTCHSIRIMESHAILVLYLCVLSVTCLAQQNNTNERNPIVTVREGKLRGIAATLLDGTPYYSFKGVPYALAPFGELRFQAPLPPRKWEGIRDAIDHGPVCTQYDLSISQIVEGSEDCLFVNIYTKSLRADAKIPVMIFIHGGSYSFNSGNSQTFSPDLFLRHNVILVTMNYRLELLGYLALDTPEVPGNAGMKDQVAALRWVKDNIAHFGGDPNSITLFGESSGGSSVTSHLLSPMSKGLFNRAIVESGTCLQDWANDRNAKERAFRAGKLLGKETNDTNELLQFLRGLKPTLLTNLAQKTMTTEETWRGLPDYFVPVVEKKFKGITAFIDEEPVNILANGKVNKVPLMIGYNSAEGLTLITFLLPKLGFYNENPSYHVQREIAEKLSQEKLREFGERIKRIYLGNKNLTKDDPQAIERLGSDIHFFYNTHRFAHLYSAAVKPVFMYRFNYDTDLNILKKITGYAELEGASHGDELFYLFYNFLNKKPYDEQEKLRQLALKMTTLWTNFAKTGNPTPDDSLDAKWLPYTRRGKEFFKIEDIMSMGNYANGERMNFWNELYKEAGVPYINDSC
ncbi:esterase FE4-like [Papilio machaon]|uniref:esterase FE4-like n=1 Tax=Papilio machaon TaxID=76193 RepID=UPI001E6642B8|nr:esterase FE4-like [Papilio machaon]